MAAEESTSNRKPLLIYWDCEAAQSNIFTGDIIEIAARCNPDIRQAAFDSLINTSQELSKFTVEKCVIKPEDLEGKSTFSSVFTRFLKWLQKLVCKVNQSTGRKYFPVLCAHGGYGFDFMMLLSNMKRHKVDQSVLKKNNLHFADSFDFCKKLQEDGVKEICETRLSMDALFSKFCPENPFLNRHRAMGDVNAMLEIFSTLPFKTAIRNIDYVTSESLCSWFEAQYSAKQQEILLEEKMVKLDAYTKSVNLKKLVQNHLDYEAIQRIFEKCYSFMDFYQAMKEYGIDRKTAKYFACQFGGMGLTNQGTEPYCSLPKPSTSFTLNFSVNDVDVFAKEDFKRAVNVPPLPESDFTMPECSESWDCDLDETRCFTFTVAKPEVPLSLTVDDFVSELPSKHSKKKGKNSQRYNKNTRPIHRNPNKVEPPKQVDTEVNAKRDREASSRDDVFRNGTASLQLGEFHAKSERYHLEKELLAQMDKAMQNEESCFEKNQIPESCSKKNQFPESCSEKNQIPESCSEMKNQECNKKHMNDSSLTSESDIGITPRNEQARKKNTFKEDSSGSKSSGSNMPSKASVSGFQPVADSKLKSPHGSETSTSPKQDVLKENLNSNKKMFYSDSKTSMKQTQHSASDSSNGLNIFQPQTIVPSQLGMKNNRNKKLSHEDEQARRRARVTQEGDQGQKENGRKNVQRKSKWKKRSEPFPEAVVFVNRSRDKKMKNWPRLEINIGDIPIYVPFEPDDNDVSASSSCDGQTSKQRKRVVHREQQTDCALYTRFNNIDSQTQDQEILTNSSVSRVESSDTFSLYGDNVSDATFPSTSTNPPRSPAIQNDLYLYDNAPYDTNIELYSAGDTWYESPGGVFNISTSPHRETIYPEEDTLYPEECTSYPEKDTRYYYTRKFARKNDSSQTPYFPRPNVYFNTSSNPNVIPPRFLTDPYPSFYPMNPNRVPAPHLYQPRFPAQYIPRYPRNT